MRSANSAPSACWSPRTSPRQNVACTDRLFCARAPSRFRRPSLRCLPPRQQRAEMLRVVDALAGERAPHEEVAPTHREDKRRAWCPRTLAPGRSRSWPTSGAFAVASTSAHASQPSPGPGEILVSSTVKDLVVGSTIMFDEPGEHELKDLPRTSRHYVVHK